MQWPAAKPVKKNQKDLTINKVKINEVYNGAIQESSAININEHTLTIKAEHVDDMIKIRLPVLQAKFVTIQKEIGTKFNLCLGTYKIKYRDEVGDWILLKSVKDLSYCIESLRKIDPNEIRLRVLPSTQQLPRKSILSNESPHRWSLSTCKSFKFGKVSTKLILPVGNIFMPHYLNVYHNIKRFWKQVTHIYTKGSCKLPANGLSADSTIIVSRLAPHGFT
ncbi:hypothetical protein E3N88_15938 [Mikania micrantha]|uniref:PB1 domain-containing protein n=1 Tax=Mikania micrantha TaxID=192012 RepID=A0A5N6NYA1_9ASTR|nr:hypothetical protein E3N88_15938 [Mikania micrantha]